MALGRLASVNPRAAEVVDLGLFAGLPISEIAQRMDLPYNTVDRDWTVANALLRSWVKRALTEGVRTTAPAMGEPPRALQRSA